MPWQLTYRPNGIAKHAHHVVVSLGCIGRGWEKLCVQVQDDYLFRVVVKEGLAQIRCQKGSVPKEREKAN